MLQAIHRRFDIPCFRCEVSPSAPTTWCAILSSVAIAFTHQPWNDGTNLDDWFATVLEAALQEPSHLTLVVAWAKRSGLQRIQPDLDAIREHGGSVSIIVGISEGGATRQGLELAMQVADRVDIFHDPAGRTFHPKVYTFRSDTLSKLLIGSNNMTAGGLYGNYEAGISVTAENDDLLFAQVEEWISRLRADKECCIRLDQTVLTQIVADERYRIGDEELERSAGAKSPALPTAPDSFLFKPSNSPKKTARRHPRLHPTGAGNGVDSATTGQSQSGRSSDGEILREWSKKLKRSDAQQLGTSTTTNLTGALRLTQNRHPIDRATYFREDFFGREIWYKDKDDPNLEYTEIVADVEVLGQYLGSMSFRVDHDLTRESGQHNFTTDLKWGPMNALLRSTSYVDRWVLLQQLEVGYRLLILDVDPKTYH